MLYPPKEYAEPKVIRETIMKLNKRTSLNKELSPKLQRF